MRRTRSWSCAVCSASRFGPGAEAVTKVNAEIAELAEKDLQERM
jgi:hypothetical protein